MNGLKALHSLASTLPFSPVCYCINSFVGPQSCTNIIGLFYVSVPLSPLHLL